MTTYARGKSQPKERERGHTRQCTYRTCGIKSTSCYVEGRDRG